MKRYAAIAFVLVLVALTGLSFAQTASKGRKLTVEDYYRLKSVGDPQISPDGKWVAFTVSTRIEQDNTTAVETYVVPSDGSAAPRKIQHEGKDVATPRWTDDNMLQYSLNSRTNSAIFIPGGEGMSEIEGQRGGGAGTGQLWKVSVDSTNATPVKADSRAPGISSADGKWIAVAKDKAKAAAKTTYASDFEKRAEEHFKGREFDWMRFQQDGQNFPTPDPRQRPVAEITITSVDGTQAKELTSLGMRPTNVVWHPGGQLIAFTADENWNVEQKYPNPQIYSVTTAGKVTRLTKDGYVWGALS
jgi:Tol biopolymer transport system component